MYLLLIRKFKSLIRSQKGIAGLEMAICFPIFVIIFFQYFGVSQNLRLVANLEKATACLGDVLVNAKPGSGMTPVEFKQTVMNDNATISKSSIEKAFKLMIERPDIKATIRVYYQQDNTVSELSPRVITISGGAGSDSSNDETIRNVLNSARRNNDSSTDQYTGDLLMVHACVNNPARDFSIVTKLVFPAVYCSSFLAARRK